MFWRFSVPTITAWCPLGSAWAPQARSGTFVNSSPELGREEVDEGHVLGGRLQERRRRRQEVDVGVGREPAVRAQVDRSVDRDLDVPESGPDDEPAADGSMIEALDDLDVDRADRQVDPERTRHVGVRVRAEDDPGARVLEDRGVDFLAVPERRQVAAILGDEPDAGRRRLVGHRQADVDADIGRRQRSDADATAGSVRTGVEVGDPDVPAVDPDPGVRRRGDVDEDARRFGPVEAWGRALECIHGRPAPADRTGGRGRIGRPPEWARPDREPEIDLREVARAALDRQLATGRDDERVGGAVEHGQRRDHDIGARSSVAERDEPETGRLDVQRDRVEPVRRVVERRRHVVGDAGLGRPPGPGQDRERAAMAGRRVATRRLAGVRAAPVDRPRRRDDRSRRTAGTPSR